MSDQHALALQTLFGFGPAAELRIVLDGADARALVRHPGDKTQQLPLFRDDEHVCGTLVVTLLDGRRLEHAGVKIEIVGRIEMPHERQASYEFMSLARELAPPGGALEAPETRFAFDFAGAEKLHESYYGRSVRLRYVLRATITRGFASSVVLEQDVWVQLLGSPPPVNNTIKMEVGIEDCLHIEFEYDKSKYVGATGGKKKPV